MLEYRNQTMYYEGCVFIRVSMELLMLEYRNWTIWCEFISVSMDPRSNAGRSTETGPHIMRNVCLLGFPGSYLCWSIETRPYDMRNVCLLLYPWSYVCWSKETGSYDVNLLRYPWSNACRSTETRPYSIRTLEVLQYCSTETRPYNIRTHGVLQFEIQKLYLVISGPTKFYNTSMFV